MPAKPFSVRIQYGGSPSSESHSAWDKASDAATARDRAIATEAYGRVFVTDEAGNEITANALADLAAAEVTPNPERLILEYDGGSLHREDWGALITPDGKEVVTFHPVCFGEHGAWRPEVVEALREVLRWSLPTENGKPR